MLALTIKKEWQESLREGRLFWIGFIILLLMTSVMFTSWYGHKNVVQQKQQVIESERKRWLEQGEKGPHSAAHYGVYVIKPNSLMSVIEPGLNAYQGHTLLLEAHKRNDSLFRPIQDAIPMQRFGELTPSFILQTLLPLLIILFGFHVFAGERESGTLKQLLATGADPKTLFIAKTCALLGLSAVFFIPLLAYFFISGVIVQSFDWARGSLFILAYLMYSFIWAMLTVIISVFAKTARTALTLLLIVWTMSCLILPKLAIQWSTLLNPIDSTREFQSRLKSEVNTPERQQAINRFKQQTLEAHNVTQPADLPFDWSGASLQFSEEYADKIFDRLFGERSQILQAQTKYYQNFAILSPLISVQNLSMAAAATDLSHHQWFINAAEIHRRLIQKTLNNNLKDQGHKTTSKYTADKDLWQKIPKFDYVQPALSTVIPHYVNALALLVFWLVITLFGSKIAINRLFKEGHV